MWHNLTAIQLHNQALEPRDFNAYSVIASEEAGFIMIYMVEHTFCLPELEAQWNAWYFDNLKVLLAVPGFHSAQRFRISDTTPPRYMAMYTIDGPEVFESKIYIEAGGNGANSARFRPAYQVWVRNLFADIEVAPDVASDRCLITADASSAHGDLPATMQWGRAVGFHKTTPYRGFAVVGTDALAAWHGLPGVTIYEPHRGRFIAAT